MAVLLNAAWDNHKAVRQQHCRASNAKVPGNGISISSGMHFNIVGAASCMCAAVLLVTYLSQ